MEHTEVFCPECSEETLHEILSNGINMVVKCQECGNIHRLPPVPEPVVLNIKAIVSREDTSSVCRCELLEDEEVSVGDYLVAESDDGEGAGVEVMSIETGDKRPERAVASKIDTLWTRVIDEVVVRVSVHDGKKTIPLYLKCEGDEKFIVRDVYNVTGIRFRIHHIRLRNGFTQKKEGKYEFANKIKRIYAYKA